jgi:hypothetical protein
LVQIRCAERMIRAVSMRMSVVVAAIQKGSYCLVRDDNCI